MTASLRVIGIVQARMGSTRLPGKVLRPLAGQPMLARVLERARQASTLHGIVVATTGSPADDAVAALAEAQGAGVFRGDEADVLGRYAGAAASCRADVIVRVTADCPLLDPGVLDEAVAAYLAQPDRLDYVSNTVERTYPRGLDVEVFPRRILERLDQASRLPEEREHVTLHLLRHRRRFRIAQVRAAADYSAQYWAVDTEADVRLMEQVYAALDPARPPFRWMDVVDLFRAHPQWRQIDRPEAALHDARLRALVQAHD